MTLINDPKMWLSSSDRQTLMTVVQNVDTGKLFEIVNSLPDTYTGVTDWEGFKKSLSKRMEPSGPLVGPESKNPAPQQGNSDLRLGRTPKMTVDPSVKRGPPPGQGEKVAREREANLKPGTHDPFTVKVPELAGQAKKKREWEHEADTGIDEDSGEYGDAGSDWGI